MIFNTAQALKSVLSLFAFFYYFQVNAQAPTTGPSDPSCDAAEVLSLCSDVYTNTPVSTFLTVWSSAALTDVTIDGNVMKLYENVDFLGIETPGPTFLDVSGMTDIHLDIWTPNMTTFRVKLVDFGPDCAFGGGDDTEGEIAITPALNSWMSVDIPLSDFMAAGLTSTPTKLAQIILSGLPTGTGTVYVDNLLFSGDCEPAMTGAPTTGPSDPSCDAAEVLSLCSDVYTNTPVSTFLTVWSAAALTDVTIDGNAMKLYENVDFLGIETPGPTFLDVSGMTDIHLDIWTPNMTTFRVKLVDFGPDCAFGGGDDTEGEIAITPALNSWMSVDIPLSDFMAAGLTSTPTKLAQIILSGLPTATGTVYVDNLLFSGDCEPAMTGAPTTGPSDPSCDAAEVLSLCSDVYTNTPVSTFLTVWSSAALTDVTIDGNAMKLYENVDFLGIETPGPTFLDVSGMTDIHLDIWTPNMTTFRVKLVDFGSDCAFGGGDDTEGEIAITPALNSWMSVDIPLSDFMAAGLTSTPTKLAQIILSGLPTGTGTVYVDNLLFSGDCDPAMTGTPTTGPSDPSCDAAEVLSLCSDVYTNTPVSTFLTEWSAASLTDVTIDGNAMKLYENVDFLGIETPGPTFLDVSEMTDIHLDIWTPNMTTFRVKLVDFGPDCAFGGGDDTEGEIAITPALNSWMSVDIPLSDFMAAGLTSTPTKLAQIIFSGLPTGTGTVYVDNLLFSGDCDDTMPSAGPSVSAPRPTCDPTDVLSLCSSTYPQVGVSTFLTSWSSASLSDFQIGGEVIKQYDNVNFLGIETVGPSYLDASNMTDFHIDIWTPNMTTLRIKLVDFGPDCAFGGGDDTEHEVVISNPALNAWMSIEIPMSEFMAGGLSSTPSKIAQIILSGEPTGSGTLYVDNMYFASDCDNSENTLPACPELVWSDEFDGSALDLTKWTPQLGDGCPSLCGWGNNELQYYQAQNAVVSGGSLQIIAKEESVAGYDYTSARIRTINLGDWTYGRFEASIKLPIGQGIWPAFWMLSTNEVYGIWPQSGEIDIMEYLGQQPDNIFGTLHFGQLFPNNQNISNGFKLCEGGFNTDFHEFAVEWDVDVIRWYVDDILYGTLTPADLAPQAWPFNRDFHLILNMAVGGNLPGPPNANTVFPQTMEVDYVRVYEGQFASLSGSNSVAFQAQGTSYAVNNAVAGASYTWAVPSGATIVSGQGTSSVVVDWGNSDSAGLLSVSVDDGCNTEALTMMVCVAEETVTVLDCVLENFDEEALITFKEASGSLEEVANPSPDAINASDLSGKYTRDPSQQFDNLQYSTAAIPDASLIVSGGQTFFMDMYTSAPIGTTILLQLESDALSMPANFPVGRHSRYEATTTTQNDWERLEFQFIDQPDAGVPDTDVDNIVLLFNPNTFTDDMYFFDTFEKYCTDTEDVCVIPEVVEEIPTMGQWGLICLSILLMIIATVAIREATFTAIKL